MRTYSDAEVRTALAKLVEESSYRTVGAETGIEFTDLNRMVRGERPVSENAGLAVGFSPIVRPRRWARVSRKEVEGLCYSNRALQKPTA